MVSAASPNRSMWLGEGLTRGCSVQAAPSKVVPLIVIADRVPNFVSIRSKPDIYLTLLKRERAGNGTTKNEPAFG